MTLGNERVLCCAVLWPQERGTVNKDQNVSGASVWDRPGHHVPADVAPLPYQCMPQCRSCGRSRSHHMHGFGERWPR